MMNTKKLKNLLDCVENNVSVLKDDHHDRLVAYLNNLEEHKTFDEFIDYIEYLFDLFVDNSSKKKLEKSFQNLVKAI